MNQTLTLTLTLETKTEENTNTEDNGKDRCSSKDIDRQPTTGGRETKRRRFVSQQKENSDQTNRRQKWRRLGFGLMASSIS